MSSIPLYEYATCSWIFRLFLVFAFTNKGGMNVCVQEKNLRVVQALFISLGIRRIGASLKYKGN